MFRIAICDDEPIICRQIESILQRHIYYKKMSIESFYTGEELAAANQEDQFDLIFLDIELPGLTGIDLAEQLMSQKGRPLLIFVSAHITYSVELFIYEPIDFLPKPMNEVKLLHAVDRAIQRHKESNRVFAARLAGNKTVVMLPYSTIRFFEANDKQVKVCTTGETYLVSSSLSKIARSLPLHFIAVHHSYIVNTEHICSFQASQVVLQDGIKIPISRAYRKSVQDFYMKFLKTGL